MDGYSNDHDSRLENFGYTPEAIRSATDQWPRPLGAPDNVQAKLQEGRRVLAAGAVAYECYVLAVRAGFEAAEMAVKHLLASPEDERGTLGFLLKDARLQTLLTDRQRFYLEEFVLQFRNDLAHRRDQAAFSPGWAAEMLEGAHRAMADIFPA